METRIEAYGLSFQSLCTNLLHRYVFSIEPMPGGGTFLLLVEGAFAQSVLTEMAKAVRQPGSPEELLEAAIVMGKEAREMAEREERTVQAKGLQHEQWWNGEHFVAACMTPESLICKWLGITQIILFRRGRIEWDNVASARISGTVINICKSGKTSLSPELFTQMTNLGACCCVETTAQPETIEVGDILLLCSRWVVEYLDLKAISTLIMKLPFDSIAAGIIRQVVSKHEGYPSGLAVVVARITEKEK